MVFVLIVWLVTVFTVLMQKGEPMSDLIERQAAISAISYSEVAYYPGDTDSECLRRDSDVKQAIMGLPSAQPERNTGKWIVHPGGKFVGFPYKHYECDQCRDFEPEARNFCPNCGADMRGEDDE